jgi:membrane associated rhomboid family serine protease
MSLKNNLLQALKIAPATFLLILANIAVFIISIALDNRGLESLSQTSFLINWGANLSILSMAGDYWRLFTSMFLHVDILHITFNMLALWSLGILLEPKLGTVYFTVLYVLSGLAGSLLSAITHQNMLLTSCGASGAILGLFGVAVIYAIKYPNQDGLSLKNLGLNLFLIFALGMMAHVDNMAHLGGFIAGLVMSALIILLNLSGKAKWLTQVIASVLVASIIGVYYWQHFDANMQKNIAAAQLSETLASMGFQDSSSANTYMYMTNAGIEEIISKGATTVDLAALSAESMVAIKALNIPENYVKEGAAEYKRCQEVAQHVKTFFTQPAEQLMWQQLGEYCQVHQNAFETITGDNNTMFSPKQYLEVNSKMSEMVQSEPMLNILNNINDLALATVNESQCPYTSCKRFK